MLRKVSAIAVLTLSLVSLAALSASAVPIDVMNEVWALEYSLSSLDPVDHDGGINRPNPTAGDVFEDEDPEEADYELSTGP